MTGRELLRVRQEPGPPTVNVYAACKMWTARQTEPLINLSNDVNCKNGSRSQAERRGCPLPGLTAQVWARGSCSPTRTLLTCLQRAGCSGRSGKWNVLLRVPMCDAWPGGSWSSCIDAVV